MRFEMTEAPLIRFQDAVLGYGKAAILSGVSLDIVRGESLGLVGPNGAGKTTFLRAVLGLLRPLSGDVIRDRSRRFAYVPQAEEINFYLPLSVRETVELALRAHKPFGRLSAEEAARVEASMAKTGVTSIGHKLLGEVSGGQRQRTILAQALSQDPDVILLDEPTR